jgi:hypothetical protein
MEICTSCVVAEEMICDLGKLRELAEIAHMMNQVCFGGRRDMPLVGVGKADGYNAVAWYSSNMAVTSSGRTFPYMLDAGCITFELNYFREGTAHPRGSLAYSLLHELCHWHIRRSANVFRTSLGHRKVFRKVFEKAERAWFRFLKTYKRGVKRHGNMRIHRSR